MPVYIQKEWYSIPLVRKYPRRLYVFGDNFVREGRKGQACIRFEPNAIGVRTKYLPSMAPNSFFSDREYAMLRVALDEDFVPIYKHLENKQTVVFPADGLGTGLAQLNEKAPTVFSYLESLIEAAKEMDGVSYEQ